MLCGALWFMTDMMEHEGRHLCHTVHAQSAMPAVAELCVPLPRLCGNQ